MRYIKDSRTREELLFKKTPINATGKQVCNAVTELLKTNEISMDSTISSCTDRAPSMIGKRKGFVFRLIGDRSVLIIHCVLHRENFVSKNVCNSYLIAFLQTVVSSGDIIRIRALHDRPFHEVSAAKFLSAGLFHRRTLAFFVSVSRDLFYRLIKLWNFFKRQTSF